MTYARIGMYTAKPGTLDDILKKAEAELVPMTRQQPGFRRYFTVRTGEDSLVSVTAWETKEQAEQAAEQLSSWVRTEMGPAVLKVENQVGEVQITRFPSGDAPGYTGYARVAVWQFKPGTADALAERAKVGMVPLMEREPGFTGYGAVRTGENSAVTVTAFASREQAQAAGEKTGVWVREHAMSSAESVERSEGEIVWSVRAG
jgi:heme-degrading monooxygenase HmoA